jgi:hypothetical protein
MNNRSSKEYRCIFTKTWKQASTSHRIITIFILSYLFVLPTSFLRIPKTYNRISLQVWHANVLYFCSFCKPTFSGATREWDALSICLSVPIPRFQSQSHLTTGGLQHISLSWRQAVWGSKFVFTSKNCCIPTAFSVDFMLRNTSPKL